MKLFSLAGRKPFGQTPVAGTACRMQRRIAIRLNCSGAQFQLIGSLRIVRQIHRF